MDGLHRITRHRGNAVASSQNGTLIHASANKDATWRLYSLLKPMPGSTIAIWRPDGTLVASKSGPKKPAV
jgi:hypothetical protein